MNDDLLRLQKRVAIILEDSDYRLARLSGGNLHYVFDRRIAPRLSFAFLFEILSRFHGFLSDLHSAANLFKIYG
jgi:hypothetical protein